MEAKQVRQYVVEQWIRWGVKRVYGVAGDAILPLLDAMRERAVEYVSCRHESAAALMASAEAKLTGRLTVCIATSGPGTANLLNGLADAHIDRVPVLAVTGQVESGKLGGPYKQYVNQQEWLAPVSHYTGLVANPEAIQDVLWRAAVQAVNRRGVGHVSVCQDVWEKLTTRPVLDHGPERPPVRADRERVRQGGDLLERARRPLFLLGTGSRRAAAHVTELAERLGAGILLTLGAKGTVPESHPHVLGGLGEGGSKAALQALHEADLLVILGATWFPRSFIPAGLPIVQVDENPESFRAHEPLLPVTGPLEEVLPVWVKRFEWHQPSLQKWVNRLDDLHQAFWQEWSAESPQDEPVRPESLMQELSRVVASDAVVALDTGEHTVWFNRAFRAQRQLPLFSGKWRTMGFGLPAAIAACLADSSRQVVAVTGDGGLQMCLGELATAAERQLPITLVVVRNDTLGLEEAKMKEKGFEPFGTRLVNPDFVQLAASFGWEAVRVGRMGELAGTLQQAMGSGRPTLVEVRCTPPTLAPIRHELLLQTQTHPRYNEK